MKQKIIAITKPLLTACMIFSWWVGSDIASFLVLGEYPYPSENEY